MPAIPYNVTQATRHPAIWIGERGALQSFQEVFWRGTLRKLGNFWNVVFLWIPILNKGGNESTSYIIELSDS